MAARQLCQHRGEQHQQRIQGELRQLERDTGLEDDPRPGRPDAIKDKLLLTRIEKQPEDGSKSCRKPPQEAGMQEGCRSVDTPSADRGKPT
ncbi:hypothetical protein ANCCAN_10434 [Ancylostoma caninum]|uniref:Uncharacterized protein n=1 Tax=Ancylostoma caninum TaxID=29170 RepID=A0A368GGT5_ANCCA|nr:hypothetical protein ANCCAN_10434 [Ancylostoma caninum]